MATAMAHSVSADGAHALSIEAALRRLDVSLAVAVRWQATWVIMSLVVLVAQLEAGWNANTEAIHNSRLCRVDEEPTLECLDAPPIIPFTQSRLLLNVLRGVGSVLTVLLVASVAKYHHSQYLIKKLSDVEPVFMPFYSSRVVRAWVRCVLADSGST